MCASGYYGHNCSSKCSQNCNVTNICDRITGECDGGCKPGWIGNTCDQSKYVSVNYINIKIALSYLINIQRYILICVWIVQVCEAGFYGRNCSNQCSLNCIVTNHCDRFSGHCKGGCKLGWTGNMCFQSKHYIQKMQQST